MVAAATAVLLAGCGNGGGPESKGAEAGKPPPIQRMEISIDGEAGPENAAILTAYQRAYLEDAGIELMIYSPVEPGRPIEYVASRMVDIGVSHLPQVAMAREKGVPIVAIGNLVPQPTMAMIWLEKSGIDSLADLKGKTVAIPGIPFQKEFLAYVLGRAGLALSDIELAEVSYELVPDLASGRVDAIFGGSGNVEGIQLEALGSKPVVISAQELGLPSFDELVVIAREDRVSKDPRLFRGFMEAVERGAATVSAEPEAGVGAIYEWHDNPPQLDRQATETAVEATAPLLSETGRIDPEQAADLLDWMRQQGMIQRRLTPSELIVDP